MNEYIEGLKVIARLLFDPFLPHTINMVAVFVYMSIATLIITAWIERKG